MYKIKAIIFDLGRVLIRIDPGGEKFGRLMRAMGIEPSRAFDKFWYARELRQFMVGEIGSEEFYRQAREHFHFPHSYDEFVDAWCDLFHPWPGMRELFDTAAARYTVGILSDTDPLHWKRITDANPWLLAHGVRPTLSFEVGYLKPHPAMYEAAALACGCRRDECLFIDDKRENVDGARFSGMPALQFFSPEKLAKDLAGLGVF